MFGYQGLNPSKMITPSKKRNVIIDVFLFSISSFLCLYFHFLSHSHSGCQNSPEVKIKNPDI